MALILLTALGLATYWAIVNFSGSSTRNIADIPTATATIMDIRDKVVEQGELESQSTIKGKCEIDYYENKIIYLAPEGSQVKKGQIVVRFERSKYEEYVSERESRVNEEQAEVDAAEQELRVQKDENAKSIRAAKQAEEFAKLDLEKYIKGDYEVQKSDMEGAISEAETAVNKAIRDLESTRTLVKGGFTDYGSLRDAEQVVKSAKLRLTRDKRKLNTLENFDHKKSKAQFEGKYEEAKENYLVAKTTAEAKLVKANDNLKNQQLGLRIQQRRLKELKEDLAKHDVKAPQDGTFVYARDNWRGNGEKLHEGKMVSENQPLFVLPDMDKMQCKVGVHESLVGKVKAGQPAFIRVDAFPAHTLRGKVKDVALMSDSNRWQPSNNYSVIVTIDSFPPEAKIKPDMNAEVEILVGHYPDVLAVPIQAVANFGRKKFVFIKNARNEFAPQEVTTGRSNISFVEIETGLKENDVVALDAYQRAQSEFEGMEPEDDDTEELVAVPPTESEVGKTSEETEDKADDLPPVPRVPENPNGLAPEKFTDSETKTVPLAEPPAKVITPPVAMPVPQADESNPEPGVQLSGPVAK